MRKHASKSAHSGLSLVELLVAVAIGLFLTFGVIAIFVMANRAYGDTERESRMGDNGRFAMQLLTREIRHAGFVGGPSITQIIPDPDLGAIIGDCTGEASAVTFDVQAGSLESSAITTALADAGGAAFGGCVADAVPGSSVLAVKSVRPVNSNAAPGGTGYHILANRISGILFNATDTTPPTVANLPNATYWEYQWHVYYVRNTDPPVLSRRVLIRNAAGQNVIETQDLIDGIEDMNAEWVDPTARQAVQVSLLIRAPSPEPGVILTGTARTYSLGGRDRIIPGDSGDSFRRIVLGAAVALRN